ncbi:acyl carrier protein [Pendulispora rubella]|uniref:Acyl carrier protein n=1 Tax=Pendulispora rubella TaxID=2741070 RepID=A0ABZ2LJU6_9BACT
MITRDDILRLFIAAEIHVTGSELDDHAPLAQQGLDSLDMANLLFQLEQSYQFSISPTEASRLRTLQDMIDCASARTAGRAANAR